MVTFAGARGDVSGRGIVVCTLWPTPMWLYEIGSYVLLEIDFCTKYGYTDFTDLSIQLHSGMVNPYIVWSTPVQ